MSPAAAYKIIEECRSRAEESGDHALAHLVAEFESLTVGSSSGDDLLQDALRLIRRVSSQDADGDGVPDVLEDAL